MSKKWLETVLNDIKEAPEETKQPSANSVNGSCEDIKCSSDCDSNMKEHSISESMHSSSRHRSKFHEYQVHKKSIKVPKEAFRLVNTSSGTMVYQCAVESCTSTFTRRSTNAKNHYLMHQKIKLSFPCPVCKKDFSRNSNMVRHMDNYHPNVTL
jgi:hypothetical protein